MFFGPAGSMYEGGFFKAMLKFPSDFPSMPPSMTFVTPILHPNIYPDGKVCISILHPPGVDQFNEQVNLLFLGGAAAAAGKTN
jgi:ubiquitin-conjugating enzyme E2 G1